MWRPIVVSDRMIAPLNHGGTIDTKTGISIPIFLNRLSGPSRQATHIPCRDPAKSGRLGKVRIDSPEDVDVAVARAKAAQKAWRTTSFEERRKVLRKLLAYTVDNKDAICLQVQRDSERQGRTRYSARSGRLVRSFAG
jgi:acyl-CoA reductase-like NAD-dependent aldehyde dehydrogenase